MPNKINNLQTAKKPKSFDSHWLPPINCFNLNVLQLFFPIVLIFVPGCTKFWPKSSLAVAASRMRWKLSTNGA